MIIAANRGIMLSLLFAVCAAGLYAAPTAPQTLRVSDTPEWAGELGGQIVGLSGHPHFRVQYTTASTQFAAVKMRIQVSASETFEPLWWDSGFVDIAATASGATTPPVAYAGPELLPGTTYFWRAACQDDQAVSGAFSLPASFTLAAAGTPADLRATTGVATESVQGNPVTVVNWAPSLTAQNTSESSVAFGQVQVSRTADFKRLLWESPWLPVGLVAPGGRSQPIPYTGVQLASGTPHFWRIRMTTEPDPTSAWSSATASFMYVSGGITSTAPAGYARESRRFGPQDLATSDIAVGDVNCNGVPDTVLASGTAGMAHLMYPDIGTATPGTPLSFGSSAGGRTLLCLADFGLNDLTTVVAIDQGGLKCYDYVDDHLVAGQVRESAEWGEPREVRVADTDWDGWLDIIVAYELVIVRYGGGAHGFEEGEVVFEALEPITGLAVTDFVKKDGLPEYWIVAGSEMWLFRKEGILPQSWDVEGYTHVAPADMNDPGLAQLVLAGPETVQRCTVVVEDIAADLTFFGAVQHGLNLPCLGVVGARLDGVADSDVVVQLQGAVLVMLTAGESLTLQEYAGHPGGDAECRVCVADTNLDGHQDIIVGRVNSSSELYFNRPRLAASIHDSSANQVLFGEAYAEFVVTLSAAPVSMVEVECETYEEDDGGDGDGDGLPDPAEWLRGQTASSPYIPTSLRLVFAPGQTTRIFYVPLTSYYAGAVWTLHARIISVVGAASATSTASASIYGVPQQSSGPPATPGAQRDWNIHGEVRSIVEANGNTYFGGDFDGVEWEAEGMAAVSLAGERRAALPTVTTGSISCVAADTDGSIYFGGSFTVAVGGGVTVKNLAKCAPNGSLVSTFAPNPNGPVYAIALDNAGRVYFGGKFSALEKHAGQVYRNIGWVSTTGSVTPGYGGSAAYGVQNLSGYGGDAQVLVMKYTASGGSGGNYLLVGGATFDRAYIAPHPTTSYLSVYNFVGFNISGGGNLTNIRAHGAVRAIEVDTSRTIGFSGQTSYPILIGGSFSYATVGGSASAMNTSPNLFYTNFSAFYVAGMDVPQSFTAVNSLYIDASARIWVGRNKQSTHDSLVVYTWNSPGAGWTRLVSFSSGLNSNVMSLVHGPGIVMAAGGFSMAGGQAASGLAAFSTSSGSLGALVPQNVQLLGGYVNRAVATYTSAGQSGYIFCGSFNSLLGSRDNLAAMNAQGQLLSWSPRTNGPVNSLAYNSGAPGEILFGGHFNMVSGQLRTDLASAPADDTSTQPSGWAPQLLGSNGINVIALEGGYAFIGGDFVYVNNELRTDLAKVNASSGGLVLTFNAELQGGSGDAVHALLKDGSKLYVGGSFYGVSGGISQPGILAVDSTTGAFDSSWRPALPWPCAVTGVAATSNEIVFIGDFTSVNATPRNGVAAVSKSGANLASLAPAAFGGDFKCVAATSGGLIYLGGDFTTIAESASGTQQQRKGMAAVDIAGTLTTWEANVLGAGVGEVVNTIRLETYGSVERIWLGGEFTGTPLPGQNDLVWYSGGWFITTASLPAASAGQPYSAPAMTMSGLPAASWSMQAPGAPALIMSPGGVISGTAPSRQPGQWLPVQVLVIAQAGAVTTSRYYTLTVTPPPPPTLVQISGPTLFDEGDDAILSPAQEWTVSLTQPFSAPVYVRMDYTDGTARNGYQYAPLYTTVVFFPSGTPVPSGLGPKVLGTNALSVQVPVITFGDTALDLSRSFGIGVTSLTANVSSDPTANYLQVTINEDDTGAPVDAYVLNLQVREDPVTPANPQGVVADAPWLVWEFGTDVAGETQSAYEIEGFSDSAMANPLFPPIHGSGGATQVQLPIISDGTDCYLRVKVIPSSPTGLPSNWRLVFFHRNTTPAAPNGLSPGVTPPGSAGVTGGRPELTWNIVDDGDGDAQHFVVHLTPLGPGAPQDIDSRFAPWLFEQFNGAWSQVGQGGVPTGYSAVRMRVPAAMALALGQWDWSVDASDAFETAQSSAVRIDVQPGCKIRGTYSDPAGGPLTDRPVNLVRLPGHTPLNAGSVIWHPWGEFEFSVTQALQPGEIIAVCLDPTVINPATGLPWGEYACAILRFPGADLMDTGGPLAKVALVQGSCQLDARGMGSFTLGDLMPAPGATPVAGFGLVTTPADMQMATQFAELELGANLRVRGDYAALGELKVIRLLAGQTLAILEPGALSVEEGGEAWLSALDNQGAVAVLSSGSLRVSSNSNSAGSMYLAAGATLDIAGATLTVSAGSAHIQNATVVGNSATDTLQVEGGSLVISGGQFDNCILEIGPACEMPAIDGASFTLGAVNRAIYWRRAMAQPATISCIQFDGVPGLYNVYADAAADALTMLGCGGLLSGETYDFDPGEGAGGDIVLWETAAVTGLAAHSGDERVLLLWDAGAQTGSGVTYEIHESGVAAGPFTLIGTTASNYYVHDALTNGGAHFYFVRTIAGAQQADSPIVACTPHDAVIDYASPSVVTPDGLFPATVLGGATHFSDSTIVGCGSAGFNIPAGSVVVLGPGLLLFDIETESAQEGQVSVDIETPDVWSELGVPAYSEALTMQLEVVPPPSPNYPTVEFVDDNGAVTEGEFTDGEFSVAIHYDDNGGAAIAPWTLECFVDRDIFVGSTLVTAGTDLAAGGYALWDQSAQDGATWLVEQVYTPTDPQAEYIYPGELFINVRVSNEFGHISTWSRLRIFVNDMSVDAAFVSAYLVQGESNQVVQVYGNDLTDAVDVEFDDPEIDVVSVDPVESGSFSLTGEVLYLLVEVNVSEHARVDAGTISVKNTQQTTIATGSYRTVRDDTPSSGVISYPDPLAATGAVGVTFQNGSFSWSSGDLSADGRAFPIAWDRTYRSDKHDRWSPLGYGWMGTYLQYIEVDWVNNAYRDFTWVAPDGTEHRFSRFEETDPEKIRDPNYGVSYASPVGLAAQALATRVIYAGSPVAHIPQEIAIQTSTGLTYFFGVESHKQLDDDTTRWSLKRVEDSNRNQHLLEYDSNGRLVRILGDALSEAVGPASSSSGTVYGDVLSITYHSLGLIKRIRRHHAEATPVNLQGGIKWSPASNTMDLESVEYWYDGGKRLVLQQLPEGTRHGDLYNGYAYEPAGGSGPMLLSKVYSPSQVINPYEVVASSTSPAGSHFTTTVAANLTTTYQAASYWYGTEYHVWQQQQLVEASGSPVYRSLYISYVPHSQPIRGSSQAVVTQPDNTTTTYNLTQYGQSSSIAVSDGNTTYHTHYVYHDTTRATAQVIRPGGNSTFYMYAHDDFIELDGLIDNLVPVGDYTEIDCVQLTAYGPGSPTTDFADYVNKLVKLRQGLTQVYRYAKVESGSSGSTLKVLGHFSSSTWAGGVVEVFRANNNPLSRYKVIQRRECAGTSPTPNDLVTTYTHRDGMRLGRYRPETPLVIDPRGNVTTTALTGDAAYLPPQLRGQQAVMVHQSYTPVDTTGPSPEPVTFTQISCADKYGRPLWQRTPDTSTSYEYVPPGTGAGSDWKLSQSTVADLRPGSSGSPAELTTTFAYDVRGNLVSSAAPHSATSPYSTDDFTTEYFYNDARQVYRVKSPAAGPQGSAVRPDTWTYYDKDGRVVREVTLISSSFAGYAATVPSGDPQNLPNSQIETAFTKPTSLRGAGWLHTINIYNIAGEMTAQTTDFDLGVTATATTTYDNMGRVASETDAAGRETSYEYELRGLCEKVIVAPGRPERSTNSYFYDPNGNLIIEGQPDGTAINHWYDGYDRRIKTTTPAAGGLLEHTIEYPAPTQPNIVKEFFTPIDGATGATRRTWTELDELGRPYRTRELAQDRQSNPLKGAVEVENMGWRFTTSNLDYQGRALRTWVNICAPGATTSGSGFGVPLTAQISQFNGFSWLNYSVTDGVSERFTYDHAGNVAASSSDHIEWSGDEPSSQASASGAEYDPQGNLWRTTDSLNKQTEYIVNNFGWVEATIDPSGRETETEYNFAGLPTKQVVAPQTLQITTVTTYDASGLTLSETAYRGTQTQTTVYLYDEQGRQSSITRPDAGIYVFQYDSMGRVTHEVRHPEGVEIVNNHDSAGNVAQVQVHAAGVTPVGQFTETQSFDYDAFGQVLLARTLDASGKKVVELEMAYNTLGLIETQSMRVYVANGANPATAIPIEFAPHLHSETDLGFKSKYESTLLAFDTWTMEAAYDALGREIATTYWDGRVLNNTYAGVSKLYTIREGYKPGTIVENQFEGGLLARRYFGNASNRLYHHAVPRPSLPGESEHTTVTTSEARFAQDPRGLLADIEHGNPSAVVSDQHIAFARVDQRYDSSGNPVFERRAHQGGQTRILKYDDANRLQLSVQGHMPATIPDHDLPGTAPEYINPVPNMLSHQSRQGYTQDSVDNIQARTSIIRDGTADVGAAVVNQDMAMLGSEVDQRNLIGQRSDASGQFAYDQAGRMTFDPTTGLSYEHNYRGQVSAVKSGTDVLRAMTYDPFGRMVHQVDFPGQDQERGTIFVPNIGFGGDGGGADTAAEVSYTREAGDYAGLEVVQFTYGYGAIGGGMGWKRLVELVAYCREFAPYYRFLHENVMGNTIATTSLGGDRLDEYDYTDYGVPMHAPVAVDGRWIESIGAHGSYADVSVVTLDYDMLTLLKPNELLGCELRVVKDSPGVNDVYAAGTVISHLGRVIHIRDVGHAVANAWAASSAETRALSAIYDLREGFNQGVMDAVSTGVYSGHGWSNEPCTFITVNHGAFDNNWMYTQGLYGQPIGTLLEVTIGPDSNGAFTTATVLGAEDPVTGSGWSKLALWGTTFGSFTGTGKRYLIDGTARVGYVAQSGAWALDAAASGSGQGSTTTFTVDEHAALSENMVGWILQPDINRQVFANITSVSPANFTITVSGNCTGSIAPAAPLIGAEGTRFRMYAPPGVTRRGELAGVLTEPGSHEWVGAESSRCLYAGYRYEAPLAGTTESFVYGGQAWTYTTYRQTGLNFAGQHYTLHRHYDPNLMRFTSPDPAADPWWNLAAYCGNGPAAGYDPDGLSVIGPYQNDWENRPTEALINTGLDIFGNILTKFYGGGAAMAATPVQTYDHYANGADEPILTQEYRHIMATSKARSELVGGGGWGAGYALGGSLADFVGYTGIQESVTGKDTVTGQRLTAQQRHERFVDGTSTALLTVGSIAAPKVVPWAAEVGGSARVGGGTSSFWRNPNRTLKPGSFAAEHIPAGSPAQTFTAAERAAIDAIGYKRGCHTCGVRIPGTKTGHWVPDHQVPSALTVLDEPQMLYPHCKKCSWEQARAVLQLKRIMKKAGIVDE